MVRRRRARRRPSAQKPFTQLTPEAPTGGQVDEDVAHVMGHADLADDDSGGVVGDVALPGRVGAHLVQGHGPASGMAVWMAKTMVTGSVVKMR